MNKISLLLLFCLSACAPYLVHQPDLASQPKDEVKYSDDLDSCRHEVFAKRGIDIGQSAAGLGLGEVGILAYGHNPAFDDVDDCLRKKGYTIN